MTEELEIRVRSDTHPNSLAGSIVAAFDEGKDVVMVAIGPVPISQTIKAVATANRFLAPRGIVLALLPNLETRQIIDKESQKPVPWVVSTLRIKRVTPES